MLDPTKSYEVTKPCLIAYIDILGFKDIVLGQDENLRNIAFQFLHQVAELCGPHHSVKMAEHGSKEFSNQLKALGIRGSHLTINKPAVHNPNEREQYMALFETSSFSDCIVISSPIDIKLGASPVGFPITSFGLLGAINRFYSLIINQGVSLLIRGAIGIGDLYHRNNIIYGKGLIEAYELERSNAIYPRIILSHEFAKRYRDLHAKSLPDLPSVAQDFDGLYFIEFMQHIVYDAKLAIQWHNIISSTLKEYEDKASYLMKWQWLASYFNKELKKAKSKKPEDKDLNLLKEITVH